MTRVQGQGQNNPGQWQSAHLFDRQPEEHSSTAGVREETSLNQDIWIHRRKIGISGACNTGDRAEVGAQPVVVSLYCAFVLSTIAGPAC